MFILSIYIFIVYNLYLEYIQYIFYLDVYLYIYLINIYDIDCKFKNLKLLMIRDPA